MAVDTLATRVARSSCSSHTIDCETGTLLPLLNETQQFVSVEEWCHVMKCKCLYCLITRIQQAKVYGSINHSSWLINSLHAIFFRGNKHVFTFHVIPPRWYAKDCWNPSLHKTRTYIFTWSLSWLLMSWRRKEPAHQQPWYWPSQNEITRPRTLRVNIEHAWPSKQTRIIRCTDISRGCHNIHKNVVTGES